MQRDTAVAVVLALLALLAIGAAGATLENPADADAGSGFGAGSGGGLGSGGGGGQNGSASSGGGMQWTGELSGACMQILQTLPAKLLLIGLVAAVSGYVWWRTDSLGFGVLTAILYGPLVYLVWFALAGCQTLREAVPQSRQPANRTQTPTGEAGGGSLGAAAESATSQPSVLLAVVLAVLIIAAVILVYVASADDVVDAVEEDPVPEHHEETDIAAVGRVAGEAADRIEGDEAFGNEVYRAWTEMTEHLAVEHPESSTPAEFAAAAVDAGMAPDDVRELTDLFEEVRYGDRAVTAERERRAADALRRIEESYAEGEE
ncbi:DUF4129 domain-containing protein [Halolamina salifodinae]|uniref:Protein-glutamine gamma-glutamyltransferase-like C-terminal domain-containing protein n=1 Tax=Halolamina salifodinae TaxID=1202767 RepID=A0A8T4GW98_9EURY|nr:DUF4129 domain-containing protein [Halolamina salifodinae]MBP1986343.1 hypothetical protein [Halolamina salifodinae]